MIELEKKILLTAEEYNFIDLHFCTNAKHILQKNHYYDNEKLELNAQKITARIREINGTFKAIIKDHSTSQTDCSVENICNSNTIYDDSYFIRMGLVCHGHLLTERKELELNGVRLMLDKNHYLDIIDYELEIEYQLGFENDALQLIKRISDAVKQNKIEKSSHDLMQRIGVSKTKSERFFERKGVLA